MTLQKYPADNHTPKPPFFSRQEWVKWYTDAKFGEALRSVKIQPTKRKPLPFRLLEHTADIGIEATAGNLAELFVACAEGLQQILCSHPVQSTGEGHPIRIRAYDSEELLVVWLAKILGFVTRRDLFPLRFQIEQIDETHLDGIIFTEPLTLKHHRLNGEIKGVTYHQLTVEEIPKKGWRAQVYLDL